MVDSSILNKTLTPEKEEIVPLPDLKTQVSQWLRFEKKQYTSSRKREKEKKGTIFTVWYSLWDIWYYSQKSSDEASKAITQSIDTLFEQLGVIAENWPTGAKIIIPEAMDPTFLPGWQIRRTGPQGSDHSADDQRNAVQLVKQWNSALDLRASDWNKGQIYIYNTNDWMLDQVREAQLVIGDMADHNGLGQNGSPWASVDSGCAGKTDGSSAAPQQAAVGQSLCSSPEKYLFWSVFAFVISLPETFGSPACRDEMHLGPEAHKMIGQGIAQDIAESHGDAWFAHEQAEPSSAAPSVSARTSGSPSPR